VPAKTTSGTPINPQGTGGGSSITYWAATGAFISLLGGSDSPPGLGGGGSARGSAGNPFGALPRPESGKNAAGGDPICPTGYAPFNTDAYAYYRVIDSNGNAVFDTTYSRYWTPTANFYFVVELIDGSKSGSSYPDGKAIVEETSWPGARVFTNPDYALPSRPSRSIEYYNRNKQGGMNGGLVNRGGFQGIEVLTQPGYTYEFANTNTGSPTVLARWSGNSNVSGAMQTGYNCNDGAVVNGRLRTVVKGDTLWDIAQAVYGDATRWPEIYAANTDVVGADPDLIFPGQVLRIP
jgi:hypothetical protein